MIRFRIFLGLLLVSFSVIPLAWSYFPLERENRVQTLRPILLKPPTPAGVIDLKPTNPIPPTPDLTPLILADPQLMLVFPLQIRYGEADLVQLVFNTSRWDMPAGFDLSNGLDTAEQAPHWNNFYNTYFVIAEARLDLIGMDVRPSDLISEPLHPGGSATFFWNIDPPQAGSYRGTAWLYLRIMDPSTSLETREAITAQIMEIQVVDFQGLSTVWVRLLAWFGIATGVILGMLLNDELRKSSLNEPKLIDR